MFKKRLIIIILSLLITLISILPEVWAYLSTPKGFFFSGINANVYFPDVEGVYFAAMSNSSKGEWLYSNPFDPNSKPIFNYPVYFILGKIVRISGLPIPFVYHLVAAIFTFIFLVFIFKLLKHFFKDFKRRLFAFALLNFGGLFFFRSTEGISLFSYSVPHLMLAQLALFVCIRYLLSNFLNKKVYSPLFTFWVLILSILQPWMTAMLFLFTIILNSYLAVRKNFNRKLLNAAFVLAIISLPFIIYYSSNVTWVSSQIPTSPFILVLLYGLILPVSIFGVWVAIRKGNNGAHLFLAIWFVFQIVLTHSPIPFSRRFVEGAYMPMAVFAIVALDFFIERFRLKGASNIIYANAFVYFSLGVIANYLMLFFWLPNAWVHKPIAEKEALAFLSQHSKSSDIVLSLPITGGYIPGYANVKVYVGVSLQTPDFERKLKIAEDFYAQKLTSQESMGVLAREDVCFVYVGPNERSVNGSGIQKTDYLINFFTNKSVTIYKTQWC